MKKAFLFLVMGMLLLPALGPVSLRGFSWADREDWVDTRLFLHDEIITHAARALQTVTGDVGSTQVLGGKDGFLFLADTVTDAQGIELLTEDQIAALADKLARLSQTLAAQGSRFCVLIAPNKATIYPDKLPDNVVASGTEGNLTRLQKALTARGVSFVDAASLLSCARVQRPVYHATDTHWNAYGAFVAAQALLTEHAGATLAEPTFDQATPLLGDLARLCMPALTVSETDLAPALSAAYTAESRIRSMSDMRIAVRNDAKDGCMVLWHDSFGEALFPYLANAMGRLVYLRGHDVDTALAAKEGVAVTVLEIAERNLPDLLDE